MSGTYAQYVAVNFGPVLAALVSSRASKAYDDSETNSELGSKFRVMLLKLCDLKDSQVRRLLEQVYSNTSDDEGRDTLDAVLCNLLRQSIIAETMHGHSSRIWTQVSSSDLISDLPPLDAERYLRAAIKLLCVKYVGRIDEARKHGQREVVQLVEESRKSESVVLAFSSDFHREVMSQPQVSNEKVIRVVLRLQGRLDRAEREHEEELPSKPEVMSEEEEEEESEKEIESESEKAEEEEEEEETLEPFTSAGGLPRAEDESEVQNAIVRDLSTFDVPKEDLFKIPDSDSDLETRRPAARKKTHTRPKQNLPSVPPVGASIPSLLPPAVTAEERNRQGFETDTSSGPFEYGTNLASNLPGLFTDDAAFDIDLSSGKHHENSSNDGDLDEL